MTGATWTSSHIYGQGLKNLDRKMFYVQIPKCASMWVRAYLAQVGSVAVEDSWTFGNFNTEDLANYRYIVVLRDPVKRWVSNCPAIDTVLKMQGDVGEIKNMFDNLKNWLWDEHSALQSDFIQGIDFSRTVFFYADQYLSANFQHFIEKQKFSNSQAPMPVNEQSHDPDTIRAADIWRELLSDPVNLEKFKQVYQADYKLIESVNFYRDGQ